MISLLLVAVLMFLAVAAMEHDDWSEFFVCMLGLALLAHAVGAKPLTAWGRRMAGRGDKEPPDEPE